MTRPSRRRFLRRASAVAAAAFAGCPDSVTDGETGSPGTDSPRTTSDTISGRTDGAPSAVTSTATSTSTATPDGTTSERGSETASPDSEAVVWERSVGSSVVATPAIDAERVYVATAETAIRAFDVETGSPVWSGGTAERIRDAALVDGTLVVVSGTNELNASHTLHGFDAATGEERWTSNPTNWYLEIEGSRAGTVYVTSYDDVPAGSSATLYAVSAADGRTTWSGSIGEARTIVASDGSVYVSSYAQVDAFDAPGGEKRWTNAHPEEISLADGDDGISVIGGDEGAVVYAYRSDDADAGKVLVGVDAENGEERWRVDRWSDVTSAVVRDGVVYAAASEFAALNARDGSVRWTDGRYGAVTATGVTRDRVYSGGYDLVAYDRENGDVDWSWDPAPAPNGVHVAGFLSGAILFDGHPDPEIRDDYKYAVDVDGGEERWVFAQGAALTNLAIGDDVAVTGSENGRLYALR